MKQKIKKFFTLNRRSNGGFTLVELVVVIAILAILAGAAVPAYSGYINKANEAADQQLLAAMNTAYASACAAEGESHIGRRDVPTTIQLEAVEGGYEVPVEKIGAGNINDNFQLFFSGGQFKRFTELGFNAAKGVFVSDLAEAAEGWLNYIWNKGNSFVGKEGDLLNLFDAIAGDQFAIDPLYLTDENGVEAFLELYLSNCDDTFLEKTGLKGIFGDIFNEMKAAEGTTEAGNAAVMLFAKDAAEAKAEDVVTDVTNFVTMVQNAKDPEALAKALAKKGYTGDNLADNLKAYYTDYFGEDYAAHLTAKEGASLFNGEEAANLALVAGSMTNEAGVSTLGSLYAIAEGYYAKHTEIVRNDSNKAGSFDSVIYAMKQGDFMDYYNASGEADVEAYLAFMGALSAGDVDQTGSGIFAGQYDYITGIIGSGAAN